jgi:hypothetical protein
MADAPELKSSKDSSKMSERIAEQARATTKQQDTKRDDFATGKKKFTEGK